VTGAVAIVGQRSIVGAGSTGSESCMHTECLASNARSEATNKSYTPIDQHDDSLRDV